MLKRLDKKCLIPAYDNKASQHSIIIGFERVYPKKNVILS